MLPETGTTARNNMERMAIAVGMDSLSNGKSIPEALYEVYSYFRQEFVITRRNEKDGCLLPFNDVVTDARELEAYVGQVWSMAISDAHTLRSANG